ncbi:MAG: sulfurtransferase-like selenium metabolism protein YedF, partial [Lachnospiraceae bacterium]
FKVIIEMSGSMEETADHSGENMVVVIASDLMGSGNDELGKVLMKGFIFAVTQLSQLPKTILFYNGGATLTAEGSDSIEDLKNMEAQGVEILTCGTCLNYYNLSDKLQVGAVTNMYSIVEKMAAADKIVRP